MSEYIREDVHKNDRAELYQLLERIIRTHISSCYESKSHDNFKSLRAKRSQIIIQKTATKIKHESSTIIRYLYCRRIHKMRVDLSSIMTRSLLNIRDLFSDSMNGS